MRRTTKVLLGMLVALSLVTIAHNVGALDRARLRRVGVISTSAAILDGGAGALEFTNGDATIKSVDNDATSLVQECSDGTDLATWDCTNGAEGIVFAGGVTISGSTITLSGGGGAGKVLTSDASGNGTWQADGGGNTLDGAYDQGGAGAGRTIAADAGSVVVTDTNAADDGLTINKSAGASNHALVLNATVGEALDVTAGTVSLAEGLTLAGTTLALDFSSAGATVGIPDNSATALVVEDRTNNSAVMTLSTVDGAEQLIVPQRNTPATPQFECSPGEGMYCSADGTIAWATGGVARMGLTGTALSIASLAGTTSIFTAAPAGALSLYGGTESVQHGFLTLKGKNAQPGFTLDAGEMGTDTAVQPSVIKGRDANPSATGGNRVGGILRLHGGDETAASGAGDGNVEIAYDGASHGLVGIGKAPSAGVELDVNGDIALSGGLTIGGSTLATSGVTASGVFTFSAEPVMSAGATINGATLDANAGVDVAGVLRLLTEESDAPTEPFACAAGTTGTIVYVDDTNDAGAAALCVCLDADDGTTLDWRRVDDHTTACPFF